MWHIPDSHPGFPAHTHPGPGFGFICCAGMLLLYCHPSGQTEIRPLT